MDNRLYWVWLQLAMTPGSPLAAPLLRQLGDARAIYEAQRPALAQAGVQKQGELQRLCDKSLDKARDVLGRALENGGWILTPADALFPVLLRGIYAPPVLLYGRGALLTEDEPCIAMVGTRKASGYGIAAASRLAAGLAAGGMTVISGGARGIDAACHTAAMDAGGRTVAFQACGLDVEYPAQNAGLRRRILDTGGTLLSEFPPGLPALAHHFHIRNRLISGIALGVCVVEAPARSGALITANLAREQGKDVFAVPGAIDSFLSGGSNGLIKGGARLVDDACEILEEYRLRYGQRLDFDAARRAETAKPRPAAPLIPRPSSAAASEIKLPVPCPADLSPCARKLAALLTGAPQPPDKLAADTELPVSAVMAALTELEIAGCAADAGGQMYIRL